MSLGIALSAAIEKSKQTQKDLVAVERQQKLDEKLFDESVMVSGGITYWSIPDQPKKKVKIIVHVKLPAGEESNLPQAKFYMKDAFGSKIFIKTPDRTIAQQFVNCYFGKGKYTVCTA